MEYSGNNILKLMKEGFPLQYIAQLMFSGKSPEENTPSKETLISLFIKHQSYKTIAKILEVSEKVVKGWFKHHGLPTNLKDMKKLVKQS